MLVIALPALKPVDTDLLLAEARAVYGNRVLDCNLIEYGARVAVYLDDGRAGASFDAPPADREMFSRLLAAHIAPLLPRPIPIRELQGELLAQVVESLAIKVGLANADGTPIPVAPRRTVGARLRATVARGVAGIRRATGGG